MPGAPGLAGAEDVSPPSSPRWRTSIDPRGSSPPLRRSHSRSPARVPSRSEGISMDSVAEYRTASVDSSSLRAETSGEFHRAEIAIPEIETIPEIKVSSEHQGTFFLLCQLLLLTRHCRACRHASRRAASCTIIGQSKSLFATQFPDCLFRVSRYGETST